MVGSTSAGYFSVVAGYNNTRFYIGGNGGSLQEGDKASLYGNYNHEIGTLVRTTKRVQVSVNRNRKNYERGVSVRPYEDCGLYYRTADFGGGSSSEHIM